MKETLLKYEVPVLLLYEYPCGMPARGSSPDGPDDPDDPDDPRRQLLGF